jgi:hypothetical protein
VQHLLVLLLRSATTSITMSITMNITLSITTSITMRITRSITTMGAKEILLCANLMTSVSGNLTPST